MTTPTGVFAPHRRALTTGLVLTITMVAFESLAVATIAPVVTEDLGAVHLQGWLFSAFFLGTLLGIVAAGRLADRRGPALPFTAGLVLFGTGLVVGGVAPSMIVLIAARAAQGVGGGAIPAVAYVSIGRGYPEEVRPRVFAVFSTAWVVPGLIGPALAGAVADQIGWRWVFLGLLPLVAGASALALPSLIRMGPPLVVTGPQHRLIDAVGVAVGAGLVLGGLGASHPIAGVALAVVGVALGWRPLLRLLPEGTLRLRPGLPAAIASRAFLTFAFFGTDAFVTLMVTDVRGRSVTVAGIALTAATLTWTAGSWIQDRTSLTWGPVRLTRYGLLLVAAGIAVLMSGLVPGVPLVLPFLGWALAGLGMGLGYPSISLLVLRDAPEASVGMATASLSLSDNLGVALGAGAAGAAVALMATRRGGLAVAFSVTLAVAVAGAVASHRLASPSQPGEA